jgi:hypothetical protein
MSKMSTDSAIVIETETSGAVSAIRKTLASYLEAHPDSAPTSDVRVARVSDGPRSKVHIVGVGALLGTGRSRRAGWGLHARRTRVV